MNRQRFLLISASITLTLSLIATLASYYHYYKDPQFILDGSLAYRGWPLYWIVESRSFWSQPSYRVTIEFALANFLIDFVFYAIVFQLPSIILVLIRERKTNSTKNLKL